MPKIEPVINKSGFVATDNFDKSLLSGEKFAGLMASTAVIMSIFDAAELSDEERAVIACLLLGMAYDDSEAFVLPEQIYDMIREA